MKPNYNFLSLSVKINNSPYVIAIKNSFIKLIPIVVVIAFTSLISNYFVYFINDYSNITVFNIFDRVTLALRFSLPYIWIFLFSYYLSHLKQKNFQIQVSFFATVSLLFFNVIMYNKSFFEKDPQFILAIIIGILNYKIFNFSFNYLKNSFLLKLKIENIYKSSFNYLVTGALHFALCLTIFSTIYILFPNFSLDFGNKFNFNNSLTSALVYNFFKLAPWILGINGSHMLNSSYSQLFENTKFNHYSIQHGINSFQYIDQSFFDLYINIGGSGATLCMVIALFFSKDKSHKDFAKLALIPSIFNINEILIYGFPIIANLYIIIPFILVPMIFTISTYFALIFHIIPVVDSFTTWISPTIINGIVASEANPIIFLWQFFLIYLGTSIYIIFLQKYEKINTIKINESFDLFKDSHLKINMSEVQLNLLLNINDAKDKLKEILEDGKFLLYFQPIIDLNTNKVVKMEALVRIDHKYKGIISPYFLEYFRTLKQLPTVDYWVIEKAFEYEKQMRFGNIKPLISINISAETFMSTDFLGRFKKIMYKYQTHPKNIVIEIIEEVCLYDINIAKSKINNLRNLGFQVAIDDFGTGYSSLSYLSDLEVDFIKIDRKFVLDLNKEKGKKVLRDIINISHSIGCKVIIEGVENESQLQLVKIFGADFVQGFYFHKPNPYDNTMEYIRKQNYTF